MPKTSFCFSLSDHYDQYKKYRTKYGGNKLTEVQHSKIINTFLEGAFNRVIKDLYIFTMPFGLGSFRVIEYECRVFDHAKYKETGEKAYVSNDHTFGKLFKIKWDKRSSTIIHKKLRIFRKSPKGARALNAHILSNPNKVYTAYKK